MNPRYQRTASLLSGAARPNVTDGPTTTAFSASVASGATRPNVTADSTSTVFSRRPARPART